MNKLKKITIVCLSLLLLNTQTAVINATESANEFSDVKQTDWYYEDILLVKQDGIMQGYEDGSFKPNNSVTLGEVQKVAAELLAEKNGELDCLANDIKIEMLDKMGYLDGHWAKNYNRYLMSKLYLTTTYFDIDIPATRGYALEFLACVLYDTNYTVLNDYLYCKDKATGYISGDHGIRLGGTTDSKATATEILYTSGVAIGDTQGYYNFYDNITRAEFAAIISRIKHPERRVKCDVSNESGYRKFAITQRSYFPKTFYFYNGVKLYTDNLSYYKNYTKVETLYGNDYGCSTQEEYDNLIGICYESIDYANKRYEDLVAEGKITESDSFVAELDNKKDLARGYLLTEFTDESYIPSSYTPPEDGCAETVQDLIFVRTSSYRRQVFQELSELIWNCMGYRTGEVDYIPSAYDDVVVVDIDNAYYIDNWGLKSFDDFKSTLIDKGVDVSKIKIDAYAWNVPDKYMK